MDETKKHILDNRFAQGAAIMSLGLVFGLFLQKAIEVKGVESFWNPSLIAMVLYCPLAYMLAWMVYSRIVSDLFEVDLAYASRLDLISYSPTLLLVLYFFLHPMTKGLFEQRLLGIAFALVCLLKAAQFFFLLFRQRRFRLKAAARASTLALFLAAIVATFVFIRSYDYLLYRTILPRLIVKRMRAVTIGNETRRVLYSPSPYLPVKNRIEKQVVPPDGAWMSFGIGVARNSWFQSDTGVEFRVLVASDAGEEQVYSRFLDPARAPEDRGWIDERVDLSKYSGREVTLTFETTVPYSEVESLKKILKSSFGYTKWLNIGKYGNIVEPVWSEPIVLPKDTGQGPNIILISFDTLGASHLGCYGYERETTPNLDRFAAGGVVFKRCVAQAPWTLPSHASLLTGQNCSAHGVVSNDFRLGERYVTLAEALRERGYQTAAITEGGNVSSVFGLDQGFESYDNGGLHGIGGTFDSALRWLEDRRNRKFFLFLHTYESHAPYIKREPYYSRLGGRYDGLIHGSLPFLSQPKNAPIYLRPEDTAELAALYDSEVGYLDAWFAKLTDRLAELGLADSTTVVVTSDHGEGFGEHDYFGHGNTLYDELVLVPLIMKGPGLPAGAVIERQVRSIDVMPTLLDLSGIPMSDGLDGESLLPLIRDPSRGSAPAISEVDQPAYGPTKKSIRSEGAKLIVVDASGSDELYDLERDPGESVNLIDREGGKEASLRARLNARIDAGEKKRIEIVGARKTAKPFEIDKSTQDKLRGLGYIN